MERYRRLLRLKKEELKSQNAISESTISKMSDWDDDEPTTNGRSFDGGNKNYSKGGDENGGNDDAWNDGGGARGGGGRAAGAKELSMEEFARGLVVPQDFKEETILKFKSYLPNLHQNASFIHYLCAHEYLKKAYSIYLEQFCRQSNEHCSKRAAAVAAIATADTTTPDTTTPSTPPPRTRATAEEKKQIASKLREDFMNNLGLGFLGRREEAKLSDERIASVHEKKRQAAKELEQEHQERVKYVEERQRLRKEREQKGFGNLLEELDPNNENITTQHLENADRRRMGLLSTTSTDVVSQQQQRQDDHVAVVCDVESITATNAINTTMNLRPRRQQSYTEGIDLQDENQSFVQHVETQRRRTNLPRNVGYHEEKFMRLRTEIPKGKARPFPQNSTLERIVARSAIGRNFTFGVFISKAGNVDMGMMDAMIKKARERRQIQLNAVAVDTSSMPEMIRVGHSKGSHLTTMGSRNAMDLPQRLPTTPTIVTVQTQSSTPILQMLPSLQNNNLPSVSPVLLEANVRSSTPPSFFNASNATPSDHPTLFDKNAPLAAIQEEISEYERTLLANRSEQQNTLHAQIMQTTVPQQILPMSHISVQEPEEEERLPWYDILLSRNLQAFFIEDPIQTIRPKKSNKLYKRRRRVRRQLSTAANIENELPLNIADPPIAGLAISNILPTAPLTTQAVLQHENVQMAASPEYDTVAADQNISLDTSQTTLIQPQPQSSSANAVAIISNVLLCPAVVPAMTSPAPLQPTVETAQSLHENFLLENIDSVNTVTSNSHDFDKMITDYAKHCENKNMQPENFETVYDPRIILEMDANRIQTKLEILTELASNVFFNFERWSVLQTEEAISIADEFLKEFASVGLVQISGDGKLFSLG